MQATDVWWKRNSGEKSKEKGRTVSSWNTFLTLGAKPNSVKRDFFAKQLADHTGEFGGTHAFPFIHQVCLAGLQNVKMLTGRFNCGDFVSEHYFREKKPLRCSFSYNFRPDHPPPTVTTSQVTYGKRSRTCCTCAWTWSVEREGRGGAGALQRQSPGGEYTMNHEDIVNVSDTDL